MKINYARGLGVTLAGVAVALVPLTACSSSTSKGSATGATSASATVTQTTVSTPATTSTTKASTVSTTKPVASTRKSSTASASRSNRSSASSSPSTCLTAHLNLASAGGGGGAGGTDYRKYSFTNTGAHTCTLIGYAGVSIVDSKGTTVQRPAQRGVTGTETPPPVKTISLGADGGKAYFLVTSINVIPSGKDCQHAFHGTRLRVYPPNNTAPLYLSDTRDFCDLGVGAVTKGVNG